MITGILAAGAVGALTGFAFANHLPGWAVVSMGGAFAFAVSWAFASAGWP